MLPLWSGHLLFDCPTKLCEFCEGGDHVADACPLLSAPKPQMVMYGAAAEDLIFFELVATGTYIPKVENDNLLNYR